MRARQILQHLGADRRAAAELQHALGLERHLTGHNQIRRLRHPSRPDNQRHAHDKPARGPRSAPATSPAHQSRSIPPSLPQAPGVSTKLPIKTPSPTNPPPHNRLPPTTTAQKPATNGQLPPQQQEPAPKSIPRIPNPRPTKQTCRGGRGRAPLGWGVRGRDYCLPPSSPAPRFLPSKGGGSPREEPPGSSLETSPAQRSRPRPNGTERTRRQHRYTPAQRADS